MDVRIREIELMDLEALEEELAGVQKDQIWQDLDPRTPERYLIVEGVDEQERAICRVWNKGVDTGRSVWVSIRAGKLGCGGRGFAQRRGPGRAVSAPAEVWRRSLQHLVQRNAASEGVGRASSPPKRY